MMKRLTGTALLVAAVLLLTWGLDASDSLRSRISRVFEGIPSQKTFWLILSGSVAAILGLGLILGRERPPAGKPG